MRVVLIEPDIAGNTGAIARLCVATGTPLDLVGPLGFQLTDRKVRRAGLDYWQHLDLTEHVDWPSCRRSVGGARPYLFSTRGTQELWDTRFEPSSLLVFGSETRGLPDSMLTAGDPVVRIPILDHRVRSLNLAHSVAIALYEALRQNRGVPA